MNNHNAQLSFLRIRSIHKSDCSDLQVQALDIFPKKENPAKAASDSVSRVWISSASIGSPDPVWGSQKPIFLNRLTASFLFLFRFTSAST